jgi:hypothetical protein
MLGFSTCQEQTYLVVGSSETFRESLPDWGQAIECLVAGCPECIAAHIFGGLDDF